MNTRKTIKINKLLLDLDNSRFTSPAESQRDAISKMMEIQADRIYRLAKDIAEFGLDPSENILVYESEDEPGFYVVAEGNRRVTALKLLLSPNIAPNEKIRKSFDKVKLTLRDEIQSIENCIVFDDDAYNHWVDLKHTGQNNGVGRVEWTAPEKARHMARNGRQSFGNQLFSFIEINGEYYKKIIDNRKNVRITNISRLFGDVKVRRFFNVDSISGELYCFQPYDRFLEQLNKILTLMIELDDKGKPIFTVNRIRSQDERVRFMHEQNITESTTLLNKPWRLIDGRPKEDSLVKTKGENSSESNSKNRLAGENTPSGENSTYEVKSEDTEVIKEEATNKPTPVTRLPKADRNNLIPSNIKLNFRKNKKCSRIFNELKGNLGFNETPNAIAIMLRIFIDLSVTTFIEDNSLIFKDAPRTPGLHDKVVMCTKFLNENKKLLSSECAAVLAFSSQISKSSGTLQQYVHNPHFHPMKDALNAEWDNFENLLVAIWS
ncbi:hypothetical protein L580_0364 [Serratia fonticola AU-P3(3)]|nr:hypothetical protein L580_0364 [Serratia fonticola AU-P3(3)]